MALLVAVEAYRGLGLNPKDYITGFTLPGFGTTSRTKNNALDLMATTEITQKTIDIKEMTLQTFISMGHKPFGIPLTRHSLFTEIFGITPASTDEQPIVDGLIDVSELVEAIQHLTQEQIDAGDLVFENVQARIRTMLLMSHGFVLGTGDLSELALGWCTYNADHMSMYNVNCSIPKTLVKFLVNYYADSIVAKNGGLLTMEQSALHDVLKDIVATPISPELLPHSGDKIVQSTEAFVGPYELHDFFLSNFLRSGFSPKKILFLSEFADFVVPHSLEERKKTLKTFLKRFFSQQFKRSCVPDGPKVGSVSLSPRGDWRMPSDADVSAWLKDLE